MRGDLTQVLAAYHEDRSGVLVTGNLDLICNACGTGWMQGGIGRCCVSRSKDPEKKQSDPIDG